MASADVLRSKSSHEGQSQATNLIEHPQDTTGEPLCVAHPSRTADSCMKGAGAQAKPTLKLGFSGISLYSGNWPTVLLLVCCRLLLACR